jgi:hypothetical protein
MQSDNIINYTNNDYYRTSVIEPPKEFLFYENNKKYTRIVIDSKDRNSSLFPYPNDYEIVLDDDINDVVSAQLVSADIPFSSYLVNSFFNTLNIGMGGSNFNVTLATGDYDGSGLATQMATVLNTASPSNFTVAYNATTDNYSFGCKASFSINFVDQKNPLNMLLGFDKKNYTSTINNSNAPYSNVIQSVFRKNFAYNKYIYLSIDQFDLNKGNAKPINKSFAALTEQYQLLSMSDKPHIVKYFSPTIPRLSKLKIAFYDRFANRYDFQNQDHRLEFLFTSFKQKSKYQNIFQS